MDKSTADLEFSMAIDHHSNGRLDQAVAGYMKVLAIDNRHPVAIHNLAVIVMEKGFRQKAMGYFEMATSLKPDYAEAFCNWGVGLRIDGQIEAAIAKFEKTIEIDPNYLNAYTNLADIYLDNENLEKALEFYNLSLGLDPRQSKVLNNIGVLYNRFKQYDKAVEYFDESLAIVPDFVDAHVNKGNALESLGRLDEAISSFQHGLALNPKLAATHNNLGIVLAKVGREEEAIACYETAISLNSSDYDILSNLGNTLNTVGKSEEALVKLQEAIAINPDQASAYSNFGNVLKDTGQYEKAIVQFKKAVEIDPNNAIAQGNLGYAYLMQGQLVEGWKGYSWRGKIKGNALARRVYDQPPWDGGNLEGKTIFVYPEQGLGDIIQFSRYTGLLKDRGARVIMEIPNQLEKLLENLVGVDQFTLKNTPVSDFDVHVSIMDLPEHFNTTLESIPDSSGSVLVDPVINQTWADRLGPVTDDLRIGLVWAGNPNHTNDRNRSIAPELFRPIVELDGVAAFSLQVGKEGEAVSVFGDKIVDLEPHLTSFAETAGAMNNLDLVISVDTSPLHVAGEIGCPAWGLITFVPDWRWLLDRDDSPWYPSMRLFRQDSAKDWQLVIDDVVTALKTFKR